MHKLSKICLKNFRSCKDVTLMLNHYTPIVGYNNAGKSTIIQGIIWLLAPSGGICENDFCGNDLSNPIEVRGELVGITQELLNQLGDNHRAKIEQFISADGTLSIKRTQSAPGSTKKDRPLFVLKPGEDPTDDTSWVINPTGIDAAISVLFPSPIHIEAMQDAAQDAAKNTSNSTLGKLLKEVLGTVAEQHGQQISAAVEELKAILSADGDKRAPELTEIDKATNTALEELFPGIQIRSEIPAPTIQTLFKAGTIKIHDPQRGDSWHDFESMGHGAQRTIQMALIRCMAERGRSNNAPACRLLLIDEPELYLHPQAIEQVRSALVELTHIGYQIVFSTHSPMLIGHESVPNTLLIRKGSGGTSVLPTLSQAAEETIGRNRAQAEVLFSLANSSQILFCEKVLLVEGNTEARLLPFIYEKTFNRTLGLDKIALVPLGGSDNTKKAMDILDTMGISHQCIIDLDALFRNGHNYGVIDSSNATIAACKEYFSQRALSGEIGLTATGLPEKKSPNGIKAADVYAECASSQDFAAPLTALHNDIKRNHNMWFWPIGDIERVLDLTGKGEKHWVRFIADAEERGLASKVLKPKLLNDLLDWIKP